MLRDGSDLCPQASEDHAKKKTTRYKEQDPKKVEAYKSEIAGIPRDKRVYVDESGFDTYLFRKHARAPRGEKVYEHVRGRKLQRRSIVAGKMGQEIVAPLEYDGTMHGDFFESWFEEQLLPAIPKGAVIIMDNASFHRKKKLYEITRRHNRELIFLPPYSPELNPIERFWHWLKQAVTETLKFCDSLEEAIGKALRRWRLHCTDVW